MSAETSSFEHFIAAQDRNYPQALAELRSGRKASHWMWYVFPQIEGLGKSATSQRFALASLAEARDYAAHEVLGPRLRECVAATLEHQALTAHEIFGWPDDLKFHASLTLFARAVDENEIFNRALDAFFEGRGHEETIKRI